MIARVYIGLSTNTKPCVWPRSKGEKPERCACEGVEETSGTEFPDYSSSVGGNWDTEILIFLSLRSLRPFCLSSEDLVSFSLEVFFPRKSHSVFFLTDCRTEKKIPIVQNI